MMQICSLGRLLLQREKETSGQSGDSSNSEPKVREHPDLSSNMDWFTNSDCCRFDMFANLYCYFWLIKTLVAMRRNNLKYTAAFFGGLPGGRCCAPGLVSQLDPHRRAVSPLAKRMSSEL